MRRSNLPTALSTLIRREQESRELHEPLGKTRLLTLTGASGVAKTRLAIELAARRIDCYRDGVRLSTCPGSAAHRHYRVGLVWRARGRSGRGEPHREWSRRLDDRGERLAATAGGHAPAPRVVSAALIEGAD